MAFVPRRNEYDTQSVSSATPFQTSFAGVHDRDSIEVEKPLVQPKSKYTTDSSRTRKIWFIVAGVLLLVVAGAGAAVYFLVIRKDGGSSSPGSVGNPNSPTGAITGGDGSVIKTENGEFTYKNQFGGYWYQDPADPFHLGARAQSWTPALNETWNWGKDIIRGVNLGGWLVTEPFIVPALYEKYPGTIDEWELTQAMRADTAGGGINQMEEHYKTFITEEDFAMIAGAGLNYIRLPIGWWCVKTEEGDPLLEGVCWKYATKAFEWARKYGLRVNLDLHTAHGSQSGWNHSGRGLGIDHINWLSGVMGIANAQRTLDVIRIITQFISQPQYSGVVTMFGILNEPRMSEIGRANVENFYYEVYKTIRGITGIGEGKGPWISFHNGFADDATWGDFLRGADRIAFDTHPYFAFAGPNTEPLNEWIDKPCTTWANGINSTLNNVGFITAGEWSLGINDCGLFLNGVPGRHSYGGNCDDWEIWEQWDQTKKDGLKEYALASIDALQHTFFWTWRIGESLAAGSVRTPLWSYKLGLQQGWMPTDPRGAVGKCASLGHAPTAPFDGEFEPWQTGGAGAGELQAAETASYVWPPTSITHVTGAVAHLPTYTPTGPIPTLPALTFTVPGSTRTIDAGNGWYAPQDTQGAMVPVNGCAYPDEYDANTVQVPAAACTGPARVRRYPIAAPMITPPPS